VDMRVPLFVAVSIVLAIALVFILFIPIVPQPGGRFEVCSSTGCISDVQYDSISYAYGGWGGYFQTGVNWYTVQSWVCFCPLETPGHIIPCCVPPFGAVIWPIVGLLLSGDVVSVGVVILGRSRRS
jgi:hypothetical protein